MPRLTSAGHNTFDGVSHHRCTNLGGRWSRYYFCYLSFRFPLLPPFTHWAALQFSGAPLATMLVWSLIDGPVSPIFFSSLPFRPLFPYFLSYELETSWFHRTSTRGAQATTYFEHEYKLKPSNIFKLAYNLSTNGVYASPCLSCKVPCIAAHVNFEDIQQCIQSIENFKSADVLPLSPSVAQNPHHHVGECLQSGPSGAMLSSCILHILLYPWWGSTIDPSHNNIDLFIQGISHETHVPLYLCTSVTLTTIILC